MWLITKAPEYNKFLEIESNVLTLFTVLGVIIILMGLLEIFFPVTCLECKKESKYICKNCFDKVPVGGWYGNNYSIFRYRGVIRKAIISLKYKFAYDLSNLFLSSLVF